MIYKSFKDIRLSALGFGAMRLPLIDGNNGQIDKAATAEMIDYAMQNGINYYDTAWGYHKGTSELVLGEVLCAKYPRESFYIASKFPGFDVENIKKAAEIFEKQLEKCRVDYFDFYLFHSVTDTNAPGYLDRELGLYDYIVQQKKQGRIKYLGFSAHASLEVMEKFLEAYGEELDFCQIQLNYVDWELQDAKSKVALLKKWGLPVWVMEPVRGGALARLHESCEAKQKALRPEWSMAEWCFRYIQSIPEVCVTLSGMSSMEQLKENIETFNTETLLSDGEKTAIEDIAKDIISRNSLLCTACRYCVEKCPQGLDIPALMARFNDGKGFDDLPEDKRPSACVGCASCESVCPQGIKISRAMAEHA